MPNHQGKTLILMSSAKPSHVHCKTIWGICRLRCMNEVLNALLWKGSQIKHGLSREVSASGPLHGAKERDYWEERICWVGSYHTKQDDLTLPISVSREEEIPCPKLFCSRRKSLLHLGGGTYLWQQRWADAFFGSLCLPKPKRCRNRVPAEGSSTLQRQHKERFGFWS